MAGSSPRTPTTSSRPISSRIDGIDALRALAILYVLLNHINMRLLGAHIPYTKSLPWQLTVALVWQGQRGVQIFFAVSGFLITSMALRRWGSLAAIRLREFYLIRFARIAPLLLALLAILSILHCLGIPHYVVSPKTGGLPAALFAALTFHIGLLEATRDYLPGNWDILWSLGVEEVFYLGFPILCRLLGRSKPATITVLAAFVLTGPFARTILTHGNPVWEEYSYLGGMDAIALGCLTAIFLSKRQLSQPTRRWLLIGGLTLLISVLAFWPYISQLGLAHKGLDMTIVAVGACMLIAVSAQSQSPAPRILHAILALGRRSYEIYLTHMFLVFALFDLFLHIGKPMPLVPLLFAATILAAALLGELVARLYSEPANHWLRTCFLPRTQPAALAPQ